MTRNVGVSVRQAQPKDEARGKGEGVIMNHVRDVGRIRSVRISVLGRFVLNESKRKGGARKRSRITFEDSRRQRCQHLGNIEEWSLSQKG